MISSILLNAMLLILYGIVLYHDLRVIAKRHDRVLATFQDNPQKYQRLYARYHQRERSERYIFNELRFSKYLALAMLILLYCFVFWFVYSLIIALIV